MYNKECISSKEQFLKENNFKEEGLTSEEAIENSNKYGKNILKQKKPKQWYNYLFESLFSPFNLILLRNYFGTYLYRCNIIRATKLCKYHCNLGFDCSKYIIRIF